MKELGYDNYVLCETEFDQEELNEIINSFTKAIKINFLCGIGLIASNVDIATHSLNNRLKKLHNIQSSRGPDHKVNVF